MAVSLLRNGEFKATHKRINVTDSAPHVFCYHANEGSEVLIVEYVGFATTF